MRTTILLLIIAAAAFSSCTSSYKTGQTPDDVYYSPERQYDDYVQTKQHNEQKYEGPDTYYDDRYLRMKVHNRIMWSDLDDWYYFDRRYSYTYYNCGCNNPWTPYTYWNNYYNPYSKVIIINPSSSVAYNHPRVFNLNTYNSNSIVNNSYSNPKAPYFNNNNGNGNNHPVRIYNNGISNTNTNSNAGNFLRNIFNNSGNNNSSGNNSSGNSGNNSSSSSGNSSSSSGSSAPVRKF